MTTVLTVIMLGLSAVQIRSTGACVAPCTAHFEVVDPPPGLTYAWAGCASGSGEVATCAVAPGGVVEATLTAGGQTARATARAIDMTLAGRYVLSNGYYSTPNGSTAFVGYVFLRPDGSALADLMATVAGNTSPTTRHHNAMRLTPGYLPPLYDPDCVPGPIRAGIFSRLQREGTWTWDGVLLRVALPDVEGATFSFEWSPEVGSQAASLILRRAINLDTGQWSGDVYGYAFLTGPPAERSASDFMPYYASAGSTHEPGGWTTIWPEYGDAYPGGFFPEVPGFFAPAQGLGYYSDSDPDVWSRTILISYNEPPPNHSSMYGMHSFLFGYSDTERPSVLGALYWHGGHDFSEDGCFGNDQGHVLTVLGSARAMVVIETGIGGVYQLGRMHAIEYPRSNDLIFADGF